MRELLNMYNQYWMEINNMKNETKKNIAAISAGFTLATLIGTFILVLFESEAQWYVGGACMVGMIITFLLTLSTVKLF